MCSGRGDGQLRPIRFPYSEIPGSMSGCRLPGAYRRLQRPSSAPGAKASTVCPYQLGNLQMMLASTIQISRYGRPRTCTSPHTRRRTPGPEETTSASARSLRTQQRAHPAPQPPRRSANPPQRGNRTRPGKPVTRMNSQCSTNEPAAPRHSLEKRRWAHDPQGHAPVCSLERR